jgi:hypothetical protein
MERCHWPTIAAGVPLLVGLFRGLYCPLCRRKIAQMGFERDKLLRAGVEALAIVATNLEHARLYFRFHPTRVPLAADPAMSTLRAFSVPNPQVTPQLLQGYQSVRVESVQGALGTGTDNGARYDAQPSGRLRIQQDRSGRDATAMGMGHRLPNSWDVSSSIGTASSDGSTSSAAKMAWQASASSQVRTSCWPQ